jgi:hypothetical protein
VLARSPVALQCFALKDGVPLPLSNKRASLRELSFDKPTATFQRMNHHTTTTTTLNAPLLTNIEEEEGQEDDKAVDDRTSNDDDNDKKQKNVKNVILNMKTQKKVDDDDDQAVVVSLLPDFMSRDKIKQHNKSSSLRSSWNQSSSLRGSEDISSAYDDLSSRASSHKNDEMTGGGGGGGLETEKDINGLISFCRVSIFLNIWCSIFAASFFVYVPSSHKPMFGSLGGPTLESIEVCVCTCLSS